MFPLVGLSGNFGVCTSYWNTGYSWGDRLNVMDQCLSITLALDSLLGMYQEKMSLLVGPQTETTKRNVPLDLLHFGNRLVCNKIVARTFTCTETSSKLE